MKINGKLMLDAIVIWSLLILYCDRSDAYPFGSNNRGKQICRDDDDCDYNELCSGNTEYNEDVNHCMRSCRYPHRGDFICVHPNVDNPECDYDWQCPDDKVCRKHKHKCVNPCDMQSCDFNAYCILYEKQTACRCNAGYIGNPYRKKGCKKQ